MKMKESLEKVTPVRVKVRRMEELTRKKEVKTGRHLISQRSIKSYLTKEGGGDNTMVVESKLSLPEGGCSLGAKPGSKRWSRRQGHHGL